MHESVWQFTIANSHAYVHKQRILSWKFSCLRLKDQADDDLDDFESACTDLASCQKTKTPKTNSDEADIYIYPIPYMLCHYNLYTYVSSKSFRPRSKPPDWSVLKPRPWPMNWKRRLRSRFNLRADDPRCHHGQGRLKNESNFEV